MLLVASSTLSAAKSLYNTELFGELQGGFSQKGLLTESRFTATFPGADTAVRVQMALLFGTEAAN